VGKAVSGSLVLVHGLNYTADQEKTGRRVASPVGAPSSKSVPSGLTRQHSPG
jgi:hypothetical protein